MKIKNYVVFLLLLIFQYSFSQDIKDVKDEDQIDVLDEGVSDPKDVLGDDVNANAQTKDKPGVKTRKTKKENSDNTSKKSIDLGTVNENLEDINETTGTINETVSSTEKVMNDLGLGDLFKPKSVVIQTESVDYDNEILNTMYNQLEHTKKVKKISSKEFKNGNAFITAVYKKGPDALWQEIPDATRSNFKMISIKNDTITIRLKNSNRIEIID